MRRQGRDDRGAAAVEFALVVPVLILLLMGIIDYGLFFTDRLAVKQGIREGARDGGRRDWEWLRRCESQLPCQ